MALNKLVFQQIQGERRQDPSTRSSLYKKISKALGVPVISYFTSFNYPSMIDNSDADMLEGLLQNLNVENGFALIISSPGGDGLAAERIVNICRSYSGTGEFTCIIPGKAKSAATMICLGASKLIMTETSELGPIDPQIMYVKDDGVPQVFSAYNLISSYKKIFKNAVNNQGRMEPYLQALAKYDEREVEQCISEVDLSKDIAVKALKTGMLKQLTEAEITNRVQIFLQPKETKVHGRPIYHHDIEQCGFNVELKQPKEDPWPLIYELYMRLSVYTKTNGVAKCIESENHSFSASARPPRSADSQNQQQGGKV